MSNTPDIETLYKNYLESLLAVQTGRTLYQACYQMGLQKEGQALEDYFESNAEKGKGIQGRDWNGRRCFIGAHLPPNLRPGDVWFDITEISPMILIPPSDKSSTSPGQLISLHPVYVWQFRTFLRLVDYHLVNKYFMNVPDLLQLDRFISMDNTAIVTDVYHEEAVAYAHWFGKYLCGQFDLQTAKTFLSAEDFLQVLPSHICLWDESEYPDSEFVRIAVGHNTLYKDPNDDFDLREEKKNKNLSDRALYEEWEYNSTIGLSTLVSLEVGLMKKLPRKAYEFVEMRNAAMRP